MYEKYAREFMKRYNFFFFNEPATTGIYALSLRDALPICLQQAGDDLIKLPQLGLPGGLQGLGYTHPPWRRREDERRREGGMGEKRRVREGKGR